MALHEPPPRFLHRRPIKFAEPLAERDQVLIIQLLAAKDKHQVIVPSPADHGKIPFVDRPQIHVANLRAERAARRHHGNPHLPRHCCRAMHGRTSVYPRARVPNLRILKVGPHVCMELARIRLPRTFSVPLVSLPSLVSPCATVANPRRPSQAEMNAASWVSLCAS